MLTQNPTQEANSKINGKKGSLSIQKLGGTALPQFALVKDLDSGWHGFFEKSMLEVRKTLL